MLPEDPLSGSVGVDDALGVKGVEHEGEGDVVHHVFGPGPDAALHDHVADVAAAVVAVVGWGAVLVIDVPAALAATIDFTFTKIAD